MDDDGGTEEISATCLVKCSVCGQRGHNRRTCTFEVNAYDRARRGSGRNVSQEARESPPPTERTREGQSNGAAACSDEEDSREDGASQGRRGRRRRRSRATYDQELAPRSARRRCRDNSYSEGSALQEAAGLDPPPKQEAGPVIPPLTAEEVRRAAASEEILGQRDRAIAAIEEDAARAVARAAAEISAEAERAVKRVRTEAERALAVLRLPPVPV